MPEMTAPQTTPPQAENQVRPPQLKSRFRKNKLLLILAIILFWFVLLIPLSFLVSEAGLVRVPFFSKFYSGPKPIRLITAETMDWGRFQNLLAERIRQARKEKRDTYRIQISEKEMTGLFAGMGDQALRNSAWKISESQMAIEPGLMELLIKMDWKSRIHLDMLFRAKPILENGNLHFEILETRLGDLRLPVSWGLAIIGNVFSRDFGSWVVQVDGQKAIKDISLATGTLDVILYR